MPIVVEYRPSLHSPPRRSPLIVGGLTIVPGVRSYDEEKWEASLNNKAMGGVIESLLDIGILRIVSDRATDGSPMLPKNESVAIALIQKTFSIQLLTEWRKSENREVVINAIDAQLGKDREIKEVKDNIEPIKAVSTSKTKKASDVSTS